ncbi:MAG: condensation domain-containing protein, partial [Myxococcota bacterium]
MAAAHQLHVHAVLLLAPRTIPKTSSGKLQRYLCRQMYSEATDESALFHLADPPGAAATATGETAGSQSAQASQQAADSRRARVIQRIRAYLREHTGVATIEPTTSVFALGLDSLGLAEAQTWLEDELGVSLPPGFAWNHATPAAMADYIDSHWATLARPSGASTPITATGTETATGGNGAATAVAEHSELPLSSGQRRLWFLDRLVPGVPVYNMVFGLRMRGPMQRECLRRAMDALLARHPVLRSVFEGRDGQPRARILDRDQVTLTLDDRDISDSPESLREERLTEIAGELGRKPFDLDRGPLLRAALVRLERDRHVLIVVQHHIISDGLSIHILARDLAAIYGALVAGAPAPVPASTPPHYRDFIRHEQDALPGLARERAFWTETLSGIPRLELPGDRTRALGSARASASIDVRGGTHTFALPGDLRRQLVEFSARHHCTPFVAILAGYAILLHRYTGQRDFGIGTVTANRPPGFANVAGFFANTAVLRCRPTCALSAADFVAALRETTVQALAHAALPFEYMVNQLPSARSGDPQPLFQAALLFENLPRQVRRVGDMEWRPWSDIPDGSVRGTAKFDLTLIVDMG